MKLIICKYCQDAFKLTYDKRRCDCGKSWGYYEEDGLHAVYGGETAVPLGFDNNSLRVAVIDQPDEGLGKRFEAFVIPKVCPTMLHSEEE